MDRRRVVRSLGAGTAAVGLTGCGRLTGSTGESVLGTVAVVNLDDEAHTVEFRVEWNGSTVHESTHDLAVSNGESPDRTWPDEAGRFTLPAGLASGEWRVADPAAADYPDCFSVLVKVSPSGRLGIFTSTNGYECSEAACERQPRRPGRRRQSPTAPGGSSLRGRRSCWSR